MAVTSWRKELESAFKTTGDKMSDLEMTLTEKELDTEFDGGYGGVCGVKFTAWSQNWVYFPCVYDGAEWVGYVRRNPCDVKTEHWGGW